MSAQACYDAIRATIAEQTDADEDLSLFELIGVIRVIEAELLAVTVNDDDDDEEDDEAES